MKLTANHSPSKNILLYDPQDSGKPTQMSEVLADEEIAAITGYLIPSRQIEWLNRNGWQHVLTAARRPVVGRVYARLKLAGIKPSSTNAIAETWTLDLTRAN